MKKKCICLLLFAILILSCLPLTASAVSLPSTAVQNYLQLGDYISIYPAKNVNGSTVKYTDFSLSGENGGDLIGEDVHMWKGGSASKWLVRRAENGSYAFATSHYEEEVSTSTTANLYFWDIEGKSTDVGANIHVWNDSDLNDISKLFYLVDNKDGDPETFYIASYYTLSKGVTRYLAPEGFSNGTSWATDGCNTVLSASGFPWRIHIVGRESTTAMPVDVSWMDSIPSCTPLSMINIPGTHDSAATNTGDISLGDLSVARCQKLFLDEQLLSGIRALDIRLGMKNNEVVLNHSIVTCYHKEHGANKGKPLTLSYALSQAKAFLAKYPSETIIFVIKKDDGDDSVVTKALSILSSYESILYNWSKSSPTLGDVRGKIVVMSRLEVPASSYRSYLGPDLRNWDNYYNDNLHFAQKITYSSQPAAAADCGVWIQDDYSCTTDNKKLQFLNTAKQLNGKLGTTDSQTPPTIGKNDFVFNYNSIATSATVTTPLVGSRTMNSYLLSDVANNGFWNVGSRMGIVMLDFADKSLATRIIDSNRKYSSMEHNYTKVVTAPTCTSGGYTTYTCTICGYKYTGDTTEMLPHDYSIVVTPPTETAQGYTTYTCKACGYSYVGNYTDILQKCNVTFVVPEGVDEIPSIYASTFTLPEPSGFPLAAPSDAVFIGWVLEQYDNTAEGPRALYYAGNTYTSKSDITLYPLYIYGVTGITRTFTLFDGTQTLYIGDTVIITAAEQDFAMGAVQGSTYRDGVAVNKSDDKSTIVIRNENVALFTLGFGVNGESQGSIISFKDQNGYLYASSSTANELKSSQTLSADGSWTLSRNSTTSQMNFVAQGSSTHNIMRFNSTYNRFTCYATQDQAGIHMYVQTAVSLDNARYTTIFECYHTQTSTATTAPTCTQEGSTDIVCNKCGQTVSSTPIPALGHSYTSVITPPTCDEFGFTTHTCTVCGHVTEDTYVLALGHSYSTDVTDPTCDTLGYTTFYCFVCGFSYDDQYVDALGHSYDGEVTAPTCTEEGFTTFLCSVCGDHYIGSYVPANGHSNNDVVTQANCLEGGYTTSTCTVCQNVSIHSHVAALGHSYDAVVTSPTCTDGGFTTNTCTRCFDSYVDAQTDALGHSLNSVTVEATCTEIGFTGLSCSRCNYKETVNEVPALGHNYESVEVEPDCMRPGYTTYTCKTCGFSHIGNDRPALGHNYEITVDPPTCTEGGISHYLCKVCGVSFDNNAVPATGHHFDDGVITTPATCTTIGIKTFTCENCDESYTEEIYASHEEITEITEEPNCIHDGESVTSCRVCGEILSVDVIEAFGHDYIVELVEPTCTEDGYTRYYCTLCTEAYVEDFTNATGHDYEYTVVEPTCVSPGYTKLYCYNCEETIITDEVEGGGHSIEFTDLGDSHSGICSLCGHTESALHSWKESLIGTGACSAGGTLVHTCEVCKVERTEFLGEANHTPVYVPDTKPTCTEEGYYEHYKCTQCALMFTAEDCMYQLPPFYVVLPASGHSYEYINIGKNHSHTCSKCGESTEEDHSFTDGVCLCGAIESSEPTVEFVETLKPSMSIVVGAEMSVAFTVPNALVGKYESFYLVVEKDMVGAEPKTVTFGYGEGQTALTPMPNATNPFLHNASFTGLTAKEMGDQIRATLYCVDADGTLYYGPTQTDSIKSYLMRGLDLATSTPEKKTMYVDMLRYGAVAQIYFGYDTDNLVTDDLTEEHLNSATTVIPEAVDGSKAEGGRGTLNTSVVLKARVTLTLSNLKPGANLANMKFIVKDALDGTVIKELPAYNLNPVMVAADFDDVGAKQMRRLITVTLYDGDTAITDTVTWSVESYVAKIRATSTDAVQIDLVNAMLTYGDAVAAYMATQ